MDVLGPEIGQADIGKTGSFIPRNWPAVALGSSSVSGSLLALWGTGVCCWWWWWWWWWERARPGPPVGRMTYAVDSALETVASVVRGIWAWYSVKKMVYRSVGRKKAEESWPWSCGGFMEVKEAY